MKLSSLKPCACCNGPLLSPGIGAWRVLRVTQAMLNPQPAREVMGLATVFDGAIQLAEAMAPRPDEAVMILGDKDPQLQTEIHVCFNCREQRKARKPRKVKSTVRKDSPHA